MSLSSKRSSESKSDEGAPEPLHLACSLSQLPVSSRVLRRLQHLRLHPRPSQIWVGAKEWGLRSVAFHWAASCFCEASAEQSPCGSCSSCCQIVAGTLPDFLWIEPKEDKGLAIEDVKALQSWAGLKSMQGRARLAVVHDAHTLSILAQNRMLKLFEETPRQVSIVLITHQPSSLLSTIRSRAMMFRWNQPPKVDSLGEDSERRQFLDRWLQSFQPSRVETATHLLEGTNEQNFADCFFDSIEEISRGCFDLWIVSKWGESRTEVLFRPDLLNSYQRLISLFPEQDWLQELEKLEVMSRYPLRNYQLQTQFESYAFPLAFRGELA